MASLFRYSRILVPTDGSECSCDAAKNAVYLAKELGARVFVLNVIDAPLAFHAGIHYAESKAEMEKSGRAATGKIKKLCGDNGVECEELILEGRPQEVIVDVAHKEKIDCIILGTVGMSAIERVLVGSVSDYVLRNAECPVMLVRK